MESDSNTLSIILMAICLILQAFFSASETAYQSLNQLRLKSRAESGDAKAQRVYELSKKYDKLITTILIGNNIVNISLSSMGTVLFTVILGATYGPSVATVVITVIVLAFGEITPKSLAKEFPEGIAYTVEPIFTTLLWLMTPITWVVTVWKNFIAKRFNKSNNDNITDAELVTLVNEAENEGELSNHEGELIRSAIQFDDVQVQEVLTPRVDVEAVIDSQSIEDIAKKFEETGFSRLPVYHETIDNITGIIHEKDFYSKIKKYTVNKENNNSLENFKIQEVTSQTLYTTPQVKISELLMTLRETHHHMAIVVDEYGGTAGIVTLEDILEELVGEIWDEHDEETEEFRRKPNGSWLVAGSANIDDVCDKLGITDKPDIESLTISGLVQEYNNKVPRVGDRFELSDYDGIVIKVAHRRVLEVSIQRKKEAIENEVNNK